MEPIDEAISIMFVGMITVFFILLLIVLVGNVIIKLSNKYLTDEMVVVKVKNNNEPSNQTYAAISAAIDIITKGKGKVTNIKKI